MVNERKTAGCFQPAVDSSFAHLSRYFGCTLATVGGAGLALLLAGAGGLAPVISASFGRGPGTLGVLATPPLRRTSMARCSWKSPLISRKSILASNSLGGDSAMT